MRQILAALCAAATAACAGGPAVRPAAFALGEPAPLLGEIDILQGPVERLDLGSLEGQVVVLELWATWCLPCVEAIPHLNELAEGFAAKGVTFVSVTDEAREDVGKFLEAHPVRGWVGLHRGELPLERLGLRGLPVTALLGRDGRVLGLTQPAHLSAAHLEAALRGERPDLPPPPVRASPADAPEPAAIAYAVQLDRASQDSGEMMWGPTEGGYEFRGLALREILRIAYDVPASRLRVEAPLPEGAWNFRLTLPRLGRDWAALLAEVQAALRAGLGLEEQRLTEEARVWVLGVADAARVEGLRAGDGARGTAMMRPDRIELQGLPMNALVEMLAQLCGQTVLDETGLQGAFEITLPVGMGHAGPLAPEALAAALGPAAGLSLTPSLRRVEIIVLRPRAMAESPVDSAAPAR